MVKWTQEVLTMTTYCGELDVVKHCNIAFSKHISYTAAEYLSFVAKANLG